jgi:hypothetical protein
MKAPDGNSFIHQAGLPRTIHGLPSWIPDFSTRKMTTPLLSREGATSYDAGGSSEARLRIAEDFSILVTQGVIVDSLAKCLPNFVTESCNKGTETPAFFLGHFMHMYNATEEAGGRGCTIDMLEKYLRTFFFFKKPDEVPKVDIETLRTLKTWSKAEDDWDGEGFEEAAEQVVRVMCDAINRDLGWGYCVTTSRRVGMVLIDSDAGDKICIFPGLKTPFVIRKAKGDGDVHPLIGECHIDGLMSGEALEREDFHVQEISFV